MRKIFVLLGLLFAVPSLACTSVIISSRVSGTGAPIMFKHRDAGSHLFNRMEWFYGEHYNFIGLVNAESVGGEVWAGTNQAGFCIMNTATYDLKDDDVAVEKMDREGIVMYRALEICATVSDFEFFLDTLSRPMGVEANFGVIDAQGGAAYYEVNNHKWVKFDVNEDSEGYRVVTNFTQTGRPEDRKGVDRYERAREIMDGVRFPIRATDLFNLISRDGKPILRDITVSAVSFSGVRPGSDPSRTVMWGAVGYPGSAACVPMLVFNEDHLPSIVRKSSATSHSLTADIGMILKDRNVSETVGKTENWVTGRFEKIHERWEKGKLSEEGFIKAYDRLMNKYCRKYRKNFYKTLR